MGISCPVGVHGWMLVVQANSIGKELVGQVGVNWIVAISEDVERRYLTMELSLTRLTGTRTWPILGTLDTSVRLIETEVNFSDWAGRLSNRSFA